MAKRSKIPSMSSKKLMKLLEQAGAVLIERAGVTILSIRGK